MTFDKRVDQRHLKVVRFVNCDAPTTSVFIAVCKSLHDRPTVEDRKMDEIGSQHDTDTWKKQKTSQIENNAGRLLQRAVADDPQLAMDLRPGSHTDHNTAVQSASFALVAMNNQTFVPKPTDRYRMVTSSGIDVQIYCGNLLDEKVDAIVNPANVHLIHAGGAARVIAEAAGRQLQDECRAYISKHKELKLTRAMHTTAGRLNPPVMYVIHVAGPSATDFPNPGELYQAVFETFYQCMLYANNRLLVSSMSIPAISSGE